MKLMTLLMTVIFTFCLIGCGSTKKIDRYRYDTYGVFNKEEKRCEGIEYDLITGNVVLGIIFVETIIAPVYFFGFSLYEPIGLKPNGKHCPDKAL